jgi:acyl-CoA hydrolase
LDPSFFGGPLQKSTGEPMETYKLVMPENLNHFGALFGGYMLMWVDEIAWMAASLEYPHCEFVTIGMDTVEFKHAVREGTILRFRVSRVRIGKTSVTYLVDVTPGNRQPSHSIFSTHVTLVRVGKDGQKVPLDG